MARYKNGINGPLSGKVGNVVAASWRGIHYLKSAADKIGKPASPAQRNTRLRFRLVTGWLQPLRDVIWVGYQVFSESKTPMNGCVSYHLKEAVKGEAPDYEIDFPKAIFSRGDLLVSLVTGFAALEYGMVKISWENGPDSIFSRQTDLATFVVYNVHKQVFVRFGNAAMRGDKQVSLKLPVKHTGDLLHFWMHYVNEQGMGVSTSVYLGERVLV